MIRMSSESRAFVKHFVRIVRVHQFRKRGLSVSKIAAAFGITKRTVYRDLAILREVYRGLHSDKFEETEADHTLADSPAAANGKTGDDILMSHPPSVTSSRSAHVDEQLG